MNGTSKLRSSIYYLFELHDVRVDKAAVVQDLPEHILCHLQNTVEVGGCSKTNLFMIRWDLRFAEHILCHNLKLTCIPFCKLPSMQQAHVGVHDTL